MACDHIRGRNPSGAGVDIFICSRGTRAKACEIAGCRNRSTKLCDFPLVGKKAGKTCDRALCSQHAHRQGEPVERIQHGMTVADPVDYCPAHHKMTRQAAEQPSTAEPRSSDK